TNPKSFGSRSRANNIGEPIRNRKLAPWAQTLARPPRIVFHFRSCIVFLRVRKISGNSRVVGAVFSERGEELPQRWTPHRLRWRSDQGTDLPVSNARGPPHPTRRLASRACNGATFQSLPRFVAAGRRLGVHHRPSKRAMPLALSRHAMAAHRQPECLQPC